MRPLLEEKYRMKNLLLEIITPDGQIFSGDIKEVILPGIEGEFGVLPEHVSLFTLLKAGMIEFIKENGGHEAVIINSGNVTVTEGEVVALVDGAVPVVTSSEESEIASALKDAQTLLKDVADSKTILASVESKIDSIRA